jgi:hypothetical protein
MKIEIGERKSRDEILKETVHNTICLILTCGTIFLIHGQNALFFLLNVKGCLIILVELIFSTMLGCIFY